MKDDLELMNEGNNCEDEEEMGMDVEADKTQKTVVKTNMETKTVSFLIVQILTNISLQYCLLMAKV